MDQLTHRELINLLVSFGVLLLAARLSGEFFRQLKMPLVVGELIAGVCLGPSVLGLFYPDIMHIIFPITGNVKIAFDSIIQIAVILLLFVAGLEVELGLITQQGKTVAATSFLSFIIPLAIGFGIAYFYPELFGFEPKDNRVFALFIGTAMAVSALPVIARTLMDLGIFKTTIGSVIISSAMLIDLMSWLLFTVALAMSRGSIFQSTVISTIGYTLIFAVLMLTGGRLLINKFLPWAERNLSWPGGFLSISMAFAFLGAALTEFIGIHAIFGAFIMGIAFGDSVHVTEKTKDIVTQFVTNMFAPIFFVSIGFKTNFIANFNLQLTVIIIGLAIFTKLVGALLGALWGGFKLKEALIVGFGLNARGAMEIILAMLALQAGIINVELFVAIVVMAVVTSVISGPILQWLIKSGIAK
jgi:Kef-type K+ transport system membrane component KefB